MLKSIKKRYKTVLVYLGLIAFVLFSVFPVFWLISSSVRPFLDLMKLPPKLVPSQISLQFYRNVLVETPFLKFMVNSLKVALISTFISVSAATLVPIVPG